MPAPRACFSTRAHLHPETAARMPKREWRFGRKHDSCARSASVQPGPGIITRKAQRSCQTQLICFVHLAPIAVSPEPAHPMKINLDRAPRKMASPPQLNNRTLAVITKFDIHAILDASICADAQGVCKLIKRSRLSNTLLTGLRKLVAG